MALHSINSSVGTDHIAATNWTKVQPYKIIEPMALRSINSSVGTDHIVATDFNSLA